MANPAWKEHAHPLKQITIRLQGTRRSEVKSIINLLDEVKAKLLEGFTSGINHDDDFGYQFMLSESEQVSVFGDEPAGESASKPVVDERLKSNERQL
jgi:hypothetical protein